MHLSNDRRTAIMIMRYFMSQAETHWSIGDIPINSRPFPRPLNGKKRWKLRGKTPSKGLTKWG